MHKNSYVFIFAAVVTITCSILLAAAANLLRDRQQENIALDIPFGAYDKATSKSITYEVINRQKAG